MESIPKQLQSFRCASDSFKKNCSLGNLIRFVVMLNVCTPQTIDPLNIANDYLCVFSFHCRFLFCIQFDQQQKNTCIKRFSFPFYLHFNGADKHLVSKQVLEMWVTYGKQLWMLIFMKRCHLFNEMRAVVKFVIGISACQNVINSLSVEFPGSNNKTENAAMEKWNKIQPNKFQFKRHLYCSHEIRWRASLSHEKCFLIQKPFLFRFLWFLLCCWYRDRALHYGALLLSSNEIRMIFMGQDYLRGLWSPGIWIHFKNVMLEIFSLIGNFTPIHCTNWIKTIVNFRLTDENWLKTAIAS